MIASIMNNYRAEKEGTLSVIDHYRSMSKVLSKKESANLYLQRFTKAIDDFHKDSDNFLRQSKAFKSATSINNALAFHMLMVEPRILIEAQKTAQGITFVNNCPADKRAELIVRLPELATVKAMCTGIHGLVLKTMLGMLKPEDARAYLAWEDYAEDKGYRSTKAKANQLASIAFSFPDHLNSKFPFSYIDTEQLTNLLATKTNLTLREAVKDNLSNDHQLDRFLFIDRRVMGNVSLNMRKAFSKAVKDLEYLKWQVGQGVQFNAGFIDDLLKLRPDAIGILDYSYLDPESLKQLAFAHPATVGYMNKDRLPMSVLLRLANDVPGMRELLGEEWLRDTFKERTLKRYSSLAFLFSGDPDALEEPLGQLTLL